MQPEGGGIVGDCTGHLAEGIAVATVSTPAKLRRTKRRDPYNLSSGALARGPLSASFPPRDRVYPCRWKSQRSALSPRQPGSSCTLSAKGYVSKRRRETLASLFLVQRPFAVKVDLTMRTRDFHRLVYTIPRAAIFEFALPCAIIQVSESHQATEWR